MLDWLVQLVDAYADIFLGLTLFSILTVIAMMTIGARVLADLPSDYFVNDEARRERRYLEHFPHWLRGFLPLLKNLLGVIFVVAGLAMLVLPGQGLMTILAGVVLLDFPGKFACERWLVRRKQVHRTIDWIRNRAGKGPLEL